MKFGTVTHTGPLQGIVRKNYEFLKSNMAAADIWKSQKSRYLRNGLTDLYEIWYADATWVSQPVRPLKNWISKIQDGGHLPFWKKLNHHISATFWPIFITFGTVMHVGPWHKVQIFNFRQNENHIPIKDDTVAENWAKN